MSPAYTPLLQRLYTGRGWAVIAICALVLFVAVPCANLLVPASLGVPVVVGPHNFNAADITELFLQARAMRVVEGSPGLAAEDQVLLDDPAARAQLATAGLKVLAENRETLPRLLGLLQPLLADLFPDAS